MSLGGELGDDGGGEGDWYRIADLAELGGAGALDGVVGAEALQDEGVADGDLDGVAVELALAGLAVLVARATHEWVALHGRRGAVQRPSVSSARDRWRSPVDGPLVV